MPDQKPATPSQAAADLGLGNLLTKNLVADMDKRKKLLQDAEAPSGSPLSPAIDALFGGAKKLLGNL